MIQRTPFLKNALFLFATCLVLGCSNGGSLGCGSSTKSETSESDGTAPKVASGLLGVYKVDSYQGSQGGCDQLTDIAETAGYVVLYSFQPTDGTGKARLGGAFCGDANLCRALAQRAPEPAIGYSFIGGDDASGWTGWAVTGTGPVEQKCGAAVQSHVLTSPTKDAVRIETKTVDVVFEPLTEEDGVATCSNKHAIAVATTDLPCKSLLVLQATRDAGL